MDAHVDIKVIQHEKEFLNQEIRRLERIIELVEAKQEKASEELEGNQFEIASEEIAELVRKVENSILHMNLLIGNLEEIEETLRNYIENKYGES